LISLWLSARAPLLVRPVRGDRKGAAFVGGVDDPVERLAGCLSCGEHADVIEVDYIPFEPGAANLLVQLVSSRYRLVHHAELVAIKGDSYRLKDRDLGRVPTAATEDS
jgi:hypothetical protein